MWLRPALKLFFPYGFEYTLAWIMKVWYNTVQSEQVFFVSCALFLQKELDSWTNKKNMKIKLFLIHAGFYDKKEAKAKSKELLEFQDKKCTSTVLWN